MDTADGLLDIAEEGQEEERYGGNKKVHTHRLQVSSLPAAGIFFCYFSRCSDEQAKGFKKLAVKMQDIINEMLHHLPEALLCFNIFLSACLAKPALDGCVAVQAVLLTSFLTVCHLKPWLVQRIGLCVTIDTDQQGKHFGYFSRTIKPGDSCRRTERSLSWNP